MRAELVLGRIYGSQVIAGSHDWHVDAGPVGDCRTSAPPPSGTRSRGAWRPGAPRPGSRRARARGRPRYPAASMSRAPHGHRRARPQAPGSIVAPSAFATVAVSLTHASSVARQSGSVRMKPIGRSQALVVQARALRRTSFDHTIWASDGPISVGTPAWRSVSASSSSGGPSRASSEARSIRRNGLD